MTNTTLNGPEMSELESNVSLKNKLYIQDSVHNATKLRNRLLKPSIVLPLGNKLISASHLKILINIVPKDIHGLTLKDICPDDRQNYASVEKVMQSRVSSALLANVIGSEGTVMYIKLCYEISSSLYNEELKPLERVYNIFHAIYFMRAWRKWLKNNPRFKIIDNFVSNSLYSSVELNGANLVLLIKLFRNRKMDEYFMPSLFNSQPNEELFRQLRSMGTLNYTKINFSLLELFHLVGRVELQNEIVYIRLADAGVCFPRNKMNRAILNNNKLPTDEEIHSVMDLAKNTAVADALRFGMQATVDQVDNCELKSSDTLEKSMASNEMATDNQSEEHNSRHTNDSSRFVEVTLENGVSKKVRKSTYLWSITDPAKHLSNDRLKRVQITNDETARSCRRRLVFKSSVATNPPILSLNTNHELQIGDWCVFCLEEVDESKTKNDFILGNVLSFRYIDGKSAKAKGYSWDFAPVVPRPNTQNRGIEVLASWFEIGPTVNFLPMNINESNSFYINIEKYVSTLICPNVNICESTNSLSISNDLAVVQNLLPQLNRIFPSKL